MNELTLTLETVTPLFLGGADPRGAPELRPPAFRGAMRYWLRAALGGVIGDSNLDELRRLESAVFGAADEKVGASGINVFVHAGNLPAPQTYKKQNPMIPKDGDRRKPKPTGRDYLFWSMDKSGKVEKGNYQPPKQFYPPDIQFDIELRTRAGVANADAKFLQAVSALWLFLHLGGIGSRARRTGGSLSVRSDANIFGLDFALSASTVSDVARQLGNGLTTVRRQFSTLPNQKPHIPSAFDILHPFVARVWVLGMWNNSETAVEKIGSALRDFRGYSEPDHRNVAKWLNGELIPTVERAAFGLPLMYRYSDGGPIGTVQGRTKPPSIERRASPLWLKVSKTAQGQYLGVATLFNSELLPQGESLHARTKGTPPPIPTPKNYDLIVKWIETQFSERKEVSYD